MWRKIFSIAFFSIMAAMILTFFEPQAWQKSTPRARLFVGSLRLFIGSVDLSSGFPHPSFDHDIGPDLGVPSKGPGVADQVDAGLGHQR